MYLEDKSRTRHLASEYVCTHGRSEKSGVGISLGHCMQLVHGVKNERGCWNLEGEDLPQAALGIKWLR